MVGREKMVDNEEERAWGEEIEYGSGGDGGIDTAAAVTDLTGSLLADPAPSDALPVDPPPSNVNPASLSCGPILPRIFLGAPKLEPAYSTLI